MIKFLGGGYMTGAYFSSFEPFQNFHLDIIKKASILFDTIHVVISVNSQHRKNYNFIDCKRIITNIILAEGITNCSVELSYDLNIKYCKDYDVNYIIRGFKEKTDVQSELELMAINKAIDKRVNTLFLTSDYPYISSNRLIDLVRNGIDATNYIPKEYFDYMVVQESKKESS